MHVCVCVCVCVIFVGDWECEHVCKWVCVCMCVIAVHWLRHRTSCYIAMRVYVQVPILRVHMTAHVAR